MLDHLAQLITEILAAHPRFLAESISVVNETPPKGLTASDAAAAVEATVDAALQSTGLGVVVRVPTVIDNLSEPTLLPLVQVQIECRENAVLNATGISQSDLALEVSKALHAMPLQPFGGTLELQTIGVEIDNGAVDSHVVTFTAPCPAGLNEARVLPPGYSINETTSEVTLTCATAGASIYWELRELTDAPTYPCSLSENATLYASPVVPSTTQYLYIAAQKDGLLNSAPVRVRVVPAPPQIASISAPTATGSTMDLEWTTEWTEVALFQVEIVPATQEDFANPIGGTLSTTARAMTISGLTYNTAYNVRVRGQGGEWLEEHNLLTSFPDFDIVTTSQDSGAVQLTYVSEPDYSNEAGHAAASVEVTGGNEGVQQSLPALIGSLTIGSPPQDIEITVAWSNAQHTKTVTQTVQLLG